MARAGLATYGNYVIEGDALTPLVADGMRHQFNVNACFLVLTQPSLETILAHEGVRGWVRDLPEERQRSLLPELQERSETLIQQCNQYGFPYVDMSADDYSDRQNDAIVQLLGAIDLDVSAEIGSTIRSVENGTS